MNHELSCGEQGRGMPYPYMVFAAEKCVFDAGRNLLRPRMRLIG